MSKQESMHSFCPAQMTWNMKKATSKNGSREHKKEPTFLHTHTLSAIVVLGIPLPKLGLYPHFLILLLTCPTNSREFEPKSEALLPHTHLQQSLVLPWTGTGSSLVTLSWGEHCLLQSHQHTSTFSPFHYPAKARGRGEDTAFIKVLLCTRL